MTDTLLQHDIKFDTLSYDQQFDYKVEWLGKLISPYFSDEVDSYRSQAKHYRMRAEFRVWHEGADTYHIMFDQHTKRQYRVDQLASVSLIINQAMYETMNFVKDSPVLRNKLFQIDYLSSTTNDLVISLLYHKPLEDEWVQQAQVLKEYLQHLGCISIIGRARKLKRVLGNDFVIEKFSINDREYSFKQIENSFTQPNAGINISMIEWVIRHAANKQTDLLELYCGAGNFSVVLSQYFKRVLATEISKTSVYAAQDNILQNKVDNLTIARLSSEEFVQAYNKERSFTRLADIELDDYAFSSILVDPPRAGCDQTTLALMANFDTIIYISCNPTTLIENIAELNLTHEVVRVALFDQFPFTHHVETGVIMKKRQDK